MKAQDIARVAAEIESKIGPGGEVDLIERIGEEERRVDKRQRLIFCDSTAATLTYVIGVVVRPHPWWEPQYLIPIAGMILGNSMTSMSSIAPGWREEGANRLTPTCHPARATATARLQRWRTATALPAGPDVADLIARLRQYLADDLDTPKALAALDGWTTDALEYGGHDAEAPRAVVAAVDALLRVDLSSPRR